MKVLVNTNLSKILIDRGILPANTRRYVIDSGLPGEALRIIYDTYAEPSLLEAILDADVQVKE